MKKFLIAALCVCLLAGCLGREASDTQEEATEETVVFSDEEDREIMTDKEEIDTFLEENGIAMNSEEISSVISVEIDASVFD